MHWVKITVLLFLFVAPSAYAVEPSEVLKDPALEARARALSVDLRCLVCQNQSIDESDAALAKDLRVLLRERLVAGDTDDEAMNYLVNRFGEFVLLKPRFAFHTLFLWLGPFLVLALGIFMLLRMRTRKPVTVAENALSEKERQKIKEIMGSEQD